MNTNGTPVIWWVRRDLRLADNPALLAALRCGGPVIPVYIHDRIEAGLGAAPKWRLGLGLDRFAQTLATFGARLVIRRGEALETLTTLLKATGARGVVWNRLYDPEARARDSAVKTALRAQEFGAQSFGGHLLFEPWTVETGQGGAYRVYTPFWKAVRDRDPGAPGAAPSRLPAPQDWPESLSVADLAMGVAMRRGAAVVADHVCVGEARAQDRLAQFVTGKLQDYKRLRDEPAADATSRLSENLAWGEIGPRSIWAAGWQALHDGHAGAETFLKELVWREFAYHLLYHGPEIATRNWRREWDGFPWQGDAPQVDRWRQGRTGVPFVDAGMREMYVTGTMHNRARMVAASYLTKHMMTDWRIGQAWFTECLIDWDPASNAMGWQWVAGSGPDAAPYFRVFNPETQAEKFDESGAYRRRFIAEIGAEPSPEALAYFDAIPRAWALRPDMGYPDPVIGLAEGRSRALAAYAARDSGDGR
jgi:deoxyribodipyrimidine photo-lyase